MEYREYIQDDKPTLFGLALIQAECSFEEPLFYVLELFRFGLLTEKSLSQKNTEFLTPQLFSQLTSDPNDCVNLVSRVFSLVNPRLKPEMWTGEIDYDLIQFHYVVKLISSNCRSLVEAILASEFLNGNVPYSSEVLGAVDSLPFGCHPNIGLGIAVKLLLKGHSVEEIKRKLPQLQDLEEDLMRGWKFWIQVVRVFRLFHKNSAVVKGNLDLFIKASSVLRAKLRRNGLHLVNR